MFDHGSWGMNTRWARFPEEITPESSEAWMSRWLEQVFGKLNLPVRFFLAGHSLGGFYCALFASKYPDRVEGLFLISPAGMVPYTPETYNPYMMRDPNDITKDRMAKADVDKMLYFDEKKKHWLERLSKIPKKTLKQLMLV